MSGTITIQYSEKLTALSDQDKLKLNLGILEWVFGEIDTKSEWVLAQEANEWNIGIFESSESTDPAFRDLVSQVATLNTGIPHGITKKNITTVLAFIPNLGGALGIMQAFDAISHELCHMIVSELVDLGVLPKRSRNKHWDKNVKPGTMRNTEVTIVHDRDWEDSNKERSRHVFRVHRYHLGRWTFGHIQLAGIDIRDLVNKLET